MLSLSGLSGEQLEQGLPGQAPGQGRGEHVHGVAEALGGVRRMPALKSVNANVVKNGDVGVGSIMQDAEVSGVTGCRILLVGLGPTALGRSILGVAVA